MSRHISVGIDIGSRNTRVVVVESEKENSGFKVVGTGISKSFGLRHGYIVNSEDAIVSIKEAISNAEKAAKIKIKRALVSIGGISLEAVIGNGSLLISKIDGEITELDVERVIKTSEDSIDLINKKVIHGFPLSFKLDNKEVLGKPDGMHGMKLEAKVLFIVSLDQHLEHLISAVESTGVEVEDIVAAPFAASLISLTKAQRTAGCVLANIGAETVSIVVFENDKPISLQVFPVGSTNITNDIALGLQIPIEEAEKIKHGEDDNHEHPRKKLEDIIEARLKDIFDLIEAHLKKIHRNELLPAGIIITGGGAGLKTIADLAKTSLKLPSRVVDPQTLDHSHNSSLDSSWSVAYGLGILGFDSSYSSDLFQINRVRMKNYFDNVFSWTKQFLP